MGKAPSPKMPKVLDGVATLTGSQGSELSRWQLDDAVRAMADVRGRSCFPKRCPQAQIPTRPSLGFLRADWADDPTVAVTGSAAGAAGCWRRPQFTMRQRANLATRQRLPSAPRPATLQRHHRAICVISFTCADRRSRRCRQATVLRRAPRQDCAQQHLALNLPAPILAQALATTPAAPPSTNQR